jgi:hypothetical protein
MFKIIDKNPYFCQLILKKIDVIITKKFKIEEYMESKNYTLIKIEGEYATLRDDDSGEELFIAMALLPPGVDVGTRLHYEMMEYSII